MTFLSLPWPVLGSCSQRVVLKELSKQSIIILIVYITKFLIVIGSPRAYLLPNRRAKQEGAQLQVSDLIRCPRDLFLMVFFPTFRKIFNINEKRYRCFRSKELPYGHFLTPKFVIDTIN